MIAIIQLFITEPIKIHGNGVDFFKFNYKTWNILWCDHNCNFIFIITEVSSKVRKLNYKHKLWEKMINLKKVSLASSVLSQLHKHHTLDEST